jgi:cation diffusion facilitator CzcD-associated flavoprotein CzcO
LFDDDATSPWEIRVTVRAQIKQAEIGPAAIVNAWFTAFSQALTVGDYESLRTLLNDDCYWRDLLTFGWKLRTLVGIPQITAWLDNSFKRDPAINFRLVGGAIESSLGDVFGPTIESFFDFETSRAKGRGYFRLIADPNSMAGARAVAILTSMHELRAFPETIRQNRLRIVPMLASEYAAPVEDPKANPDVVVVGAGQAGLMLAARLKQLGVKTLLVEKSRKVGDVWRARYRNLKLHNETSMNHFPYLNFPESWPVYLPRDKVVSWLEFYAESMDLAIATGTTFVSGAFDQVKGNWNCVLREFDGREYTVNPKHVVLAAGVSGVPNMPKIAASEKFKGAIMHSSSINYDLEVLEKKIVVVGAGVSAHDIAQMSYMNGADVTLVQRSSITVASLEPSSAMAYETYRSSDGVKHIDDVDLMYASVPYDLLRRLNIGASQRMMKLDEKLLSGLKSVGFLLDNGEDETGFVMKVFRYQGGYYINVGASDLIIEKKIKLKTGVEVSAFEESSIKLSDGSRCPADIVVFATGYKPLEHTVDQLFGADVAARVGPIWGIGDDGEIRGMFADTGQPNFYVTGGGIAGARAYSRYLALLIKARLEGLVPPKEIVDAMPGLVLQKHGAREKSASDAH